MIDDTKALDKIKAGRFVRNNGRVLRTINMLRFKFVRLSDAQYALDDIPDNEFLDSVNFLQESRYIQLRDLVSHQSALLSDTDYEELEAKLTDKGIRLLAGRQKDELVDV